MLLVPGFAYLLLLILFVAVSVFQALAQIETEQQQLVFFLALLLVCFLCMLVFRRPRARSLAAVPATYVIFRTVLHVYFFAAGVVIGLYHTIPYLLVISLMAFGLEILIHFWVRDQGTDSVRARASRLEPA